MADFYCTAQIDILGRDPQDIVYRFQSELCDARMEKFNTHLLLGEVGTIRR